ncbi:hypothetical protein LCGC14_2533560 [marine sediment metagenome]|uniref:Uncharacterized protein n=1 Tax=marine sediment metagenome TaxID=412755 RepID=A0A0F9BFP4_9ZZZZ
MNNKQIDKQIKSLESQKHENTIRGNLKKNTYDTLFFTYEANYKNRVHFAYLAYESTYDCYSILCMEDEWLDDGRDDEGHKLDISELLDNEAIFMSWKEAVRDMCPKCSKYLSLSKVILDNAAALKLEGEEIISIATSEKTELSKQVSRLKRLAEKQCNGVVSPQQFSE